MSAFAFEPLLPQLHQLGEGPVWSEAEQALWYVDIPGHRIHRHDWATGHAESWRAPSEPGSLSPATDGSVVVALRDGFHAFHPATAAFARIAAPPGNGEGKRFNDGRCDRQGRFWAGTMNVSRQVADGGLWSLDRGTLRKGPHGATISNGLAWSPDSAWMYWSDSAAGIVWRFAYDPATGTVHDREPWFRCEEGAPDGAAVDTEGHYWTAIYGGGVLLRLTPDGRVERRIPVPAMCPTMVAFVGPGLDTLVVTTGRRNRPDGELDRLPLSGAVLVAATDGVRGIAEVPYRSA